MKIKVLNFKKIPRKKKIFKGQKFHLQIQNSTEIHIYRIFNYKPDLTYNILNQTKDKTKNIIDKV